VWLFQLAASAVGVGVGVGSSDNTMDANMTPSNFFALSLMVLGVLMYVPITAF
jgi:hypothetical protein